MGDDRRYFIRHCYVAFFVTAMFFAPSRATAWGIVGHRIVCEIAHQQLSGESKRAVAKLIEAFKKPNGKRFNHFVDSCSFADTARHNARDGVKRWKHYAKYDSWHYLNVPRTTKFLTADTIQCNDDCVLHAIDQHAKILANHKMTAANRGEALILLAHWIADIHQPLHVAFADDRGGSDIELQVHSVYGRHLHSAWDTGIHKARRGETRLKVYIANLRDIEPNLYAHWNKDIEPLIWANESYQLATSNEAGYCRWQTTTQGVQDKPACLPISKRATIDNAYQNLIGPALERRLQQAAVRLATTIEHALN